jgi:hypothetical protein
MIHSRGGRGVRQRGHSYERKVVNELKAMGIDCCTSRLASKATDDAGVDIFIKDGTPLNVQCKCHNVHKNPIPALEHMPSDTNLNVVFEKIVNDGEYAFMYKEDFYELISTLLKEQIWKKK